MEGHMRKFTEKVNFFNVTHFPKRYYVIDFEAAYVYIKTDPKSTKDKDIKSIHFRDIQDVYLPE